MIDVRNGDLTFDGPLTLGPSLSLAAFEKLTGKSGSQGTFALGEKTIGGKRAYVVVVFHGNLIDSIEFAFMGPDASLDPGADPATIDEPTRHQAQKIWLAAMLGPPNRPSIVGNDSYVFEWGEIGSIYDPRNESSSIFTRYRWMGKPWRPDL